VYTRCTDCHTVHPVSAAILARSGGRFRCGKCNKTGNALEALFDEWPNAGDKPPEAGDLPVLGLSIDLDAAAESRLGPEAAEPTGEETEQPTGRARLLRLSWVSLAVVTLAVTAYLYAEFVDRPLPEHPMVRDALIGLGLKEPPRAEPYRALSYIHLVSRELRSHPSRPGMLQLSATIVNRAAQTQPYPELEVVLLDAGGQALDNHRFPPRDYLASGIPSGSGMTPQAYLPVVLNLPDPGKQAVGFEINFH
jgi:predicted Zn finger-like uncharacterized protein